MFSVGGDEGRLEHLDFAVSPDACYLAGHLLLESGLCSDHKRLSEMRILLFRYEGEHSPW